MALALFLLLLLVPASSARYLSGEAIETLPGMMAIDGISPAPTEAPGLNGIPKELRNRAVQTFIETPPSSWCGFIDGNYRKFSASITFFADKSIILSLSNLAKSKRIYLVVSQILHVCRKAISTAYAAQACTQNLASSVMCLHYALTPPFGQNLQFLGFSR